MFNWKGLAAATLLAAAPAVASAQVVYDNGSPNGVSGNEMTEWIQAEDFTLGATTDIGGIRFWDVQGSPGYGGSISWFIFGNAGGVPGATLFQGIATPTRTAQGTGVNGMARFQNDFAVMLSLGPGTYWLGLHNGPTTTTTRQEFYWETTNGNATATGREDQTPFGDNGWSSNGQEHAFQLMGTQTTVPEPATVVLMATGLVGIGAAARRRQRRRQTS